MDASMKYIGEVVQGAIVIGRIAYLYHKNRKPYLPLGVFSQPARLTRKEAIMRALDGNERTS